MKAVSKANFIYCNCLFIVFSTSHTDTTINACNVTIRKTRQQWRASAKWVWGK